MLLYLLAGACAEVYHTNGKHAWAMVHYSRQGSGYAHFALPALPWTGWTGCPG